MSFFLQMKENEIYCPVVGKCPHEPVTVIPNSYFLIQPFDEEKKDREHAIKTALDNFYGKNTYFLNKSDERIRDSGVYCDICLKMKKSKFCIVDMSGEAFKIMDELTGSIQSKLFLRPNVALELGMAYAFNKSVIVLSNKVYGKRLISSASDLGFVRYVDISPKNEKGWPEVSNILLGHLHEIERSTYVKKVSTFDEMQLLKALKEYFILCKKIKKNMYVLRDEKPRLVKIVNNNGFLEAILKNSIHLFDGICFKLYFSQSEFEYLVGILEIYHVQPNGIAQAYFIIEDNIPGIFEGVILGNLENEAFHLDNHRLEFIVPELVESLDEHEISILNNLFFLK